MRIPQGTIIVSDLAIGENGQAGDRHIVGAHQALK